MIDLLCFEAKEGLGGGWPDRFWRVYRAVNLRRVARAGRAERGRIALPQSYVAQLPADLPIVPLETCDDRQRAFDNTERFLDGWYDPPDLDYQGFDLGQIVRYKVAVYAGGLHRAVRAVDVAERLLTETAARSVMVVDGVPYLERGLVALAQAQGRRARYLWPVLFRAPLVAAYDALQFRVDYRPDEVTLLGVAPPATPPTLAPADAVAWVIFHNHLRVMVAVLGELRQRGHTTAFVLPRQARRWAAFAALPDWAQVVWIEDLLTGEIAGRLEEAQRRYRALFARYARERFPAYFQHRGVNLWPLVRPGMRLIFERYLPQCVGYLDVARAALTSLQPRVVLGVHTKRAADQCFFGMARRQGIPVALVSTAFKADMARFARFDYGDLNLADLLCVTGEAERQAIQSHLRDPDKAVVVGNPALDHLAAKLDALPPTAACRAEVAQALGIPPARRWVVYTTGYINTFMFAGVLEALTGLPDTHLIVKVHPGESAAFYAARVPAAWRDRVALTHTELDLHRLLRASDAVVSYVSTTLLEAMLLERPVVVVNFSPLENPLPIAVYGLPESHTVEALRANVGRALDDSAWRAELLARQQRFVADYAYRMDGQAAARVADALERVMKRTG